MGTNFIHIEENGIKYLIHPEGSVFEGMKIRENPDDAFYNAIKRGMKKPEEWMYMYSENGKDYFKNSRSRLYRAYSQFGIIEKIKSRIQKER